MLLIFLGAPGSGKGTQAKIISSLLELKHISTGDMLREVSRSGTELGNKIAEIIANGGLVTDESVNQIVKATFDNTASKLNLILDGYPRTLAQAKFLETITSKSYAVCYFKISTDKLKTRILSRFTCADCGEIYSDFVPLKKEGECNKCHGSNFVHRADDNAESLITRIKIYEEEVSAILQFYKDKNKLIEIDADESVESVTKQIIESIKNN